MKLNASILYHDLSAKYPCEFYGPETTKLSLGRPVFYFDEEKAFEDDHLYIANAEHLPAKPALGDNVVVICVGKGTHLTYYKKHCTVIHITKNVNFIEVAQFVHSIYDRYDEWNDKLLELIRKEEDPQELLNVSLPIFGRLLSVMDRDFNYLFTASDPEGNYSTAWDTNLSAVPQDMFGKYLDTQTFHTENHEPFHIDFGDISTLCVNLFDLQDTYMGCLMVDRPYQQYNLRDDSLAMYLGSLIEELLNKTGYRVSNEHNQSKQLLQDILNGLPVSPRNIGVLRKQAADRSYVCIVLHSISAFTPIYSNFICNIFESNFPGSFSFLYDDDILGILDLESFTDKNGEYVPALNAALSSMLNSLKLTAGISNDFSDLENLPIYYAQAESAHRNGTVTADTQNYFYFSSYALMDMLSNTLGGYPAEMYYPKGLKKLLEHDETSNVNYLETLKTYLEENMSLNRTAEALYVHRSTLVDRINRMQKDLSIDLDDPNERLQLMMLLKAMEVEDVLK